MDADLMGSSGLDPAFHERVFSGQSLRKRAIVGNRVRSGFVYPDFRLVLRVFHAEELFPHGTAFRTRRPGGDHGVRFVHLVILQRVQQAVEGTLVFRYEEDSRGIPVDPVDERGSESERVELVFQIVHRRFDDRIFVALMVPGVHVRSRGLVDDEDVFVFQENSVFRENELPRGRDAFRSHSAAARKFREFLILQEDFHDFARTEAVVPVALLSVDFRPVRARNLVNQRERGSRQDLFQELIEAKPVFGLAGNVFPHLLEYGEVERFADGRLFDASDAGLLESPGIPFRREDPPLLGDARSGRPDFVFEIGDRDSGFRLERPHDREFQGALDSRSAFGRRKRRYGHRGSGKVVARSGADSNVRGGVHVVGRNEFRRFGGQ